MALGIKIKFTPFCERSPPWGGSDWSTTVPYHLNQLLYGGTVEFLDHLNQDLIWEIKTAIFFSFLKASPIPLFSYKTNGSHESQHPKHLLSFIGEAKLPTSKYIPVHLYGPEGSRPEKNFFLNFPFLFRSSRRWVILLASLRQRSFHFNSAFVLCKWFVVRNHSGKQPKSVYGWAQMKPWMTQMLTSHRRS